MKKDSWFCLGIIVGLLVGTIIWQLLAKNPILPTPSPGCIPAMFMLVVVGMATTQMQTERVGNIVQAILALAGLFGAGGLCFVDAYTSFIGLSSFFSTNAPELGRFWVPLFLSTLTIGFTAYSTEFVEDAFQGQYRGAKPGLFVLILMLCIFYDYLTGFLGMLCLMTGSDLAGDAFMKTSGSQKIVSAALAVIMVISPFIVGKFLYKVKEDPGIIGRFFRSFGE